MSHSDGSRRREEDQDPQAAILWKAALTEHVKRRLVEFELTRRERTLLVLTVALAIGGVFLALIGELYASAPFATGAVASGRSTPPTSDRERWPR